MIWFMGVFMAGLGANCFFRTISRIVGSLSCSAFVNIARYTPRYVLLGSVVDANQMIGGFPEPRFRFVGATAPSPSLLFEDICACFFSNADSVVSLRASPSSSSSDSDESEPDRLSSRSIYY